MTDASHRIIADLLLARTGQQLTEDRLWRISSALSGLFRRRGISNVDQLACLLAEPGDSSLANEVVEALLNNETYFFRDHAYFAALSKHVLPALAQNRSSTKKLRIWSAGCSTGQEALSLAMLFAEQPARWSGWDIEILGTDISSKAIETARAGSYSQFEIQRGISVAQMLRFFTETESGWQASDAIRDMTHFERQSILEAPPRPRDFDLVMCRNVLLYFDPVTRREAFERLSQGMATDGWLMLGAGETTLGQTERFLPADCGSGIFVPSAGIGQATVSRAHATA